MPRLAVGHHNPYQLAYHAAHHLGHYAGRQARRYLEDKFHQWRKRTFSQKKPVGKNKKEEKLHGDDVHSGITSTGYRIKVNEMPKRLKLVKGQNIRYHETKNNVAVNSAGLQNVENIIEVGTVKSLILADSSAELTSDTTKVSFLSLNPYATNTGSSYFGSSVKPSNDAIFLKNCDVSLEIVNSSTVAAEADLYVLKYKQYNANGPQTVWTDSLKSDALGQPAQVYPPATTCAGVPGYELITDPGLRPSGTKGFNNAFKVLKVHHLNLGPAAYEKVNFNLEMNLLMSVEKVAAVNPAISGESTNWTTGNIVCNFMKGGIAIMLVHKGAVVISNAVTESGADGATYGVAKLGVVINTKYDLKVPYDNTNRLAVNVGSNLISTGALDTQLFIIDNTDKPVAEQTN